MDFLLQPLSRSGYRFTGRTQQEIYYRRFTKMSEADQRTLKTIYRIARAGLMMEHVREAARAAKNSKDFRFLWLDNICTRLKSNLAWNRDRFKEKLEDFHIAVKAFVEELSLEEAAETYQPVPKEQLSTHGARKTRPAPYQPEDLRALIEMSDLAEPYRTRIKQHRKTG